MKRKKLLVVLLVLSLSVFIFAGCGGGGDIDDESSSSNQSSSSSEEEVYSQDFTLVNKTGVEIFAVYLAPSSAAEWSDDILTTDTLADGGKTKIVFDSEVDEQYWDLAVEDSEGEAIQWTEIDLFTISELTLMFENGEPTATYK